MRSSTSRVCVGLVAVALAAAGQAVAAASPTPSPKGSTPALQEALVARSPATGEVTLLGSRAGLPIAHPDDPFGSATPVAVARRFMSDYGPLFGVRDQQSELALRRVTPAERGRSVVRFQQRYHGIPVLAGELNVDVTAGGGVLSANGEISADLGVSIVPVVGRAAARTAAIGTTAIAHHLAGARLAATRPVLWVYDRSLIGGPGPDRPALVWRAEVTSVSRPDVRELVLVSAATGNVLLHFNQVDSAKVRRICDAKNTNRKVPCVSPYARSEGQRPTGNRDVDRAYTNSGIVYDFYRSRFHRDSIDGKGMALKQTVRYCPRSGPCPYANAFWNGSQMVYGTGYAGADDVVGHEMTHGVTDRTSKLLYWFQSGAINESISDVMGEFIDLTDKPAEPAARAWQLGEGLPDPDCFADGAVRSLSQPTRCQQPDSMTSALYDDGLDSVTRQPLDSGGVHTNSGVGNKAAYLMTHGGSFHGQTVSGIGISRAAAIWYETDRHLLTSGADYQDLATALYQACVNLKGTRNITQGTCTQVRRATTAVAMTSQPGGGTQFPAVSEAPVCAAGQQPHNLFGDGFENGLAKWQKTNVVGARNAFRTVSGYATAGRMSLQGRDLATRSDTAVAMSSGVTIPAAGAFLRYSSAVDFEYGYDDWFNFFAADGGVVEYRLDGIGPWLDAGSLFDHGGYMTDPPIYADGDNPLAGRPGFVTMTGGYYSSRLDLSSLAGHQVSFRFRLGTDTGNELGGGPLYGWIIDDVRIYTCS